MDEKTLRKVREKLDKALAADRVDDAIPLLAQLVAAEPTSTRWAHKRGDLLRRVGRKAEAIACYEQAVDLYAGQGFIARAIAMAKTVLSLDPSRVDVLQRVDPQAAQQLLRQVRPASIAPAASRGSPTMHGAPTLQGRKHAAVLPDSEPVSPPARSGDLKHPMLLDDEEAAPPARAAAHKHPMLLDDEEAAPPVRAAAHKHPMLLDDEDASPPAPAAGHKHAMVLDDEPAPVLPSPRRQRAAVEAPVARSAQFTQPLMLDDAEEVSIDAGGVGDSDHPIVIDDDAPDVPAAAEDDLRADQPAPKHHPMVLDDDAPEPVAAQSQPSAAARSPRAAPTGSHAAIPAPKSPTGSQAAIPAPKSATGFNAVIAPPKSSTASNAATAAPKSATGSHAAIPAPKSPTGSNAAIAAPKSATGSHAAIAAPKSATGSHAAIPAPKSPTGSNPMIAPPSAAGRPRGAPPPPPPQALAKPTLTLDRLSLPPAREPSAQGALKPTQQGFRDPAGAPAREPSAQGALKPTQQGPRDPGGAPAREPSAQGALKPTQQGFRDPAGAPKTPGRPGPPAPAARSGSASGAKPAPPTPGSGSHAAAPPRPAADSGSNPRPAASSAGSAPSAPRTPTRISQPGGPAAYDANSAPLWADAASYADSAQDGSRPHARPQRSATASGGGGQLHIRPYEPPADEAELFSRALEAAVELSVAPDIKPNETRFSNAPPSAALELSEAEVSPRMEAAVDEAQDAVPHGAQVLGSLPLFPLFAEMPQDVLAEMITDTELIELSDGEYVMRQGDPGDALFGIAEGSVVIEIPGQQKLQLTLSEGDVFGESCLLQDEPRHADVRVVGRLTALRIPRHALLHALRSYPRLAELLLELLTRRLLGNLLQTSLLFQEFDAEGRRELTRLFEVRRAPAGTQLAVAGKLMDGLYISLTGTLSVESPGEPERVAAPGSMFGQHTLLSQEPSPSTVTARVNLVVLRLPSAAFAQVAMQYPTVVARLAELSTSDVVSVGL